MCPLTFWLSLVYIHVRMSYSIRTLPDYQLYSYLSLRAKMSNSDVDPGIHVAYVLLFMDFQGMYEIWNLLYELKPVWFD